MDRLLELLSIGLTPPTILLSVAVVVMWYPKAREVLFTAHKTATAWFVIGVFIGFLGESLDNLYWMLAWTLHYMDHHQAEYFMQNGYKFNIPFRQLCGITAALCHIKSALQFSSEGENDYRLKFIVWTSIATGIIYALFLAFVS